MSTIKEEKSFTYWQIFIGNSFMPCECLPVASRNANNKQRYKMKTKLIETTLEHKNWTGLTLRELLEFGRVYAGDRGTLMAFVKGANGEPKTIDALTQYRAAVAGIQSMHGITA